MDVFFRPGYADVEDKIAYRIVSIPVDQDQMPARGQNSVHFGYGPVLVGVMMKGIGAGHQVKTVVGKGQMLRVALQIAQFSRQPQLFGLDPGILYHIFRHIQSNCET